ncbi:MAG TPA: STAS domain-containing protein, partial [Aquabacterium sp.]|uniref:STAS domain-containing protein n=1 Tax=Aquabacterium sp. TaxID=1872578 RepID=UPI002E371886
LDMLRKIRREGLSHDSALALSTPSNLDSDSSRMTGSARSDMTVKAKIDEIEQQMVGSGESRRSAAGASTLSGSTTIPGGATQPASLPADGYAHTRPFSATPGASSPATADDEAPITISESVLAAARAHQPSMVVDPELSPLPASHKHQIHHGYSTNFAVEVSEVNLDPDLDEAVIAFANADFEQCERDLLHLIQPGGLRHEQSDTWMVLFDLYRALDLPAKFDALAVSFVHQFGLSAPQWYSLPERVSHHLSLKVQGVTAETPHPNVLAHRVTDMDLPKALEGWIAPPHLDVEAVGRLRCEVLQLPRPWAMDWAGVESISAEAAGQLTSQLKVWAQDTVAMTWIGVDRLLDALSELSPTGNRDADPAFWMLRMELLRLCNRPDQFDETAIDYCVTYELSPPSWESTQCTVKLMSDAACTQTVSLSHIGDVSTSFVESQLHEDIEFIQLASLELSGQLVGDIGDTLGDLDAQLGSSVALAIDCAHLIRVDFIAAGDLLNWVLARRAEKRSIEFINPHRLIALFFGAMGITEHAKVKLQAV